MCQSVGRVSLTLIKTAVGWGWGGRRQRQRGGGRERKERKKRSQCVTEQRPSDLQVKHQPKGFPSRSLPQSRSGRLAACPGFLHINTWSEQGAS